MSFSEPLGPTSERALRRAAAEDPSEQRRGILRKLVRDEENAWNRYSSLHAPGSLYQVHGSSKAPQFHQFSELPALPAEDYLSSAHPSSISPRVSFDSMLLQKEAAHPSNLADGSSTNKDATRANSFQPLVSIAPNDELSSMQSAAALESIVAVLQRFSRHEWDALGALDAKLQETFDSIGSTTSA